MADRPAPGPRRLAAADGRTLVKMSELARESGVPAPTIKHYFREGLLPETQARTSRNMAYYDLGLVPRIRAIKELQRTRFLPLRLIRDVLDQSAEDKPIEVAVRALERTLEQSAPKKERSRRELMAAGMPAEQLEYFMGLGVVSSIRGEGDDAVFSGDDLGILQTLGAARRAGITPEMLPFTTLGPYAKAINDLVQAEMNLFREGILPRAGADLEAVVEAATALSEELVVRLRRKILLPALKRLADRTAAAKEGTAKEPAVPAVRRSAVRASRRDRRR